ncbi:MAG: hypothetical protein RIG84_14155 [Roseovarius sp.]
MNITFHPSRKDVELAVSKAGDTLTINGESFDFSGIPSGATLPREAIACDWIAGPVERDDAGVLTVPLILPHGANAPKATRFPADLANVADGPVPLPAYEVTA